MNFEELVALARVMSGLGASVDTILLALRSEGASQGSCLRVLRDVEGGSIGDWKQLVDECRAWSDRRSANNAWREGILKAFDELEPDENP